ncbi:MAG: glycerophosphodiester phosphodiesterase [Burkholderia sp.]
MTDPKSWPYDGVAHIVAHRGGGKLAPENTLAGLEEGARRGHRMVEFDAKLSADGLSFLLHDDTVERTSNGRGPAAAMRYEALAALDAGAWFDARFTGERMPTLEAVAARCLALGLAANVEIKPCPGREVETGERVALDTARYWRGAAVPPLLSSSSVDALDAARRAVPELPRGLLVETLPPDWCALTAELGCVALHANHREFDAARVAEIRAAGLRMLAYTVNEPARARELIDWGIDLICTDRIDLIGPEFAEDSR